MKVDRRSLLSVGAAAVAGASLSACGKAATRPVAKDSSTSASSSSAPSGSGLSTSAPASIVVGNLPPTSQADQRKVFEKTIASFMKKYPQFKVKTEETAAAPGDLWDAKAWTAMLAAGTLPNVMWVPVTEAGGLTNNKQVANLKPALDALQMTSTLNPDLVKLMTSADGGVYGVPGGAYAMGLLYNRDLFQKAGLDPDNPPSTWEDLRAAAKQIKDKTGQAGYATWTASGLGGWATTSAIYALGGTVQDEKGTKITIDDEPARKYLQLLHDMKWVDKSMPATVVYDADPLWQDFAAGKIGMFIAPTGNYSSIVGKYKMDPTVFGAGSVPQADPDKPRALTGGSFYISTPKATPEQTVASCAYINYAVLGVFSDQELAVADAKAKKADGVPVAVPGLPTTSWEIYTKYMEWVKPYNDVPVDQFKAYTDGLAHVELVPEPLTKGQEMYTRMSSMVQKVLSEEKGDPAKVLAETARELSHIIVR